MPETERAGVAVRSRQTTQERVRKIEPVELYRSSKRVITFMGTDVDRTAGPELHAKIVQRSATDHQKIDAKITLPPEALVKLSEALASIDVVREAGAAIVVPADGSTTVGQLQEIVDALVADPDRLAQLTPDTVAKLDSQLHQVRRLTTMRDALRELDEMLDGGIVAESAYQDWCSRNGWAFGIDYQLPDKVRSIAAEDRVDMLLPRLTGYRDVVELKRPDKSPIDEDKDRGTWCWSREASRAISQALRYAELLSKNAEHGLSDHREIVAYCPLAIVVMGRSSDWTSEQTRWLVRLNAALLGVQVITYDDLRARAARMLEVVSEG